MAKDDYDVIVYRILVYYYALMKRKIVFEETTFYESVKKNVENDQYFADILRLMQDEELLQGLSYVKAWGGDYILVSNPREAKITAKGIHYLKDNSKMKQVGETLKEAADIIATLAGIIKPY